MQPLVYRNHCHEAAVANYTTCVVELAPFNFGMMMAIIVPSQKHLHEDQEARCSQKAI